MIYDPDHGFVAKLSQASEAHSAPLPDRIKAKSLGLCF